MQNSNEGVKGHFYNLNNTKQAADKHQVFLERLNDPSSLYRVFATDFKKIPGCPIAYWVSKRVSHNFSSFPKLGGLFNAKKGLDTGENERFIRVWHEVNFSSTIFDCVSVEESTFSYDKRWYPINRGGDFRKWYGNLGSLINWKENGREIRTVTDNSGKVRANLRSEHLYFKESITWGAISSSGFSARYCPQGGLFGAGGYSVFSDDHLQLLFLLGFFCSKLSNVFLKIIAPTLNFEAGNIRSLPIKIIDISRAVKLLLEISKTDWDFFESSWGFSNLPLLHPNYTLNTMEATYNQFLTGMQEMTIEMHCLEEENNRIFIEAYGLQDELTPEVPLSEITLTCNPHHRYKGNKTEEELEVLLLADTMKEFLSYAVGCMFGRYSLDKPGLILANQGETIEDYLQQIPKPSFPADEDNVIPILDQDWFIDDITSRFYEFLKTTFGPEHYEENLKFITAAIGKDIRKYFLKDFYKDHLKTYKKRPIYWLFSSPKGSFNVLIYMHRYRPDTASVILNDYLREFRTKLIARREHLEQVSISGSASKQEKTKALKEIEKLKKTITELDGYENETLYPLATQNIEIDLDDGVKVNYKKIGKALKKVPGLS